MSELEEWRQTHHPDYEVSNLGRVRSWRKRSPWHSTPTEPHLHKLSTNRGGYLVTGVAYRNIPVHTLVAAAFIGPRPPGQHVMHKDDNRQNARATNLEYGTPLRNIQDCVSRGRRRYLSGETNHRSKLTESQVSEIRERAGREPQTALAQQFGVHQVTISKIQRRQRWRHV